MSAGQTDLEQLVRSMGPKLLEGVYVFCSVSPDRLAELAAHATLVFREQEGLTIVLPKATAERAGLDGAFPSRQITLTVHSSLDAVGFLATITSALAQAGIRVNAVSAIYHDHLFVPVDRAKQAMDILSSLTK